MQINPGGQLDIEDVIGRDDEIARYWRVIGRQGLVISAERRIGKTHIVRKMRDECRDGYLPFYQDLEAVHTTPELIRSIYDTVHQSLDAVPRLKAYVAKWTPLFPSRIAGVDLPTGAATSQALLSQALDDLAGIADDKLVLMLWDEFPLMLDNIQRREGTESAIQLLDCLRALRLRHSDRLRLLFTGSIGLHLVLRSLRKAGNTNDPVNDMLSLTVPPLADEDATRLATALLKETRAAPAQIPALAARIASEVGGFPYHIHHVVDQLDQVRRPLTIEDVSSAVDALVLDPGDPAHFNHYVNRLSSYYTDDERTLALLVLRVMAGQPSPTPALELLNLCRHVAPSLADEQMHDILTVLAQDHYIELRKSAEGVAYDFRWRLVKRWWRERRP